ncbi:MAG: sodium:solute symporter [Ginsengibacter sp.]
MKNLSLIDISIILLYLAAMVAVGIFFSRKNNTAEQFTKASGKIPSWAIGLSLYATFLSSNTFLGVPGKAFGSNWNAFVFSLSMPFAAWVATKYFVPFYRKSGEISAYTHFENRFGPWARTYAVICFLLTQLARIGSVFFGIALSLQALTGYGMAVIMIVMGICIIIYTVAGGMEAIIWTEVVQAVVKTFGAVLILYLVIRGVPGGVSKIISIGKLDHKFSLGGFSPVLTQSTFWVILFYGFFINLNNFGIDQNYVQRYHTASSATGAAKSVWLCVKLYVPISLLFFIIGTALYAYYQVHPGLTEMIRLQAAAERLPSSATPAMISKTAASLQPSDYGDKIMPHFMVTQLPAGALGLIISAILAAAMSTISSGMNASATVFTEDIYKRYFNKKASGKKSLSILYLTTFIFGVMGMMSGIAMIGRGSILDIWWILSGIFAAGMLGLFLLGIISRHAGNVEALIATIIGIIVIVWMALPQLIPEKYASLRSTIDKNLIIVIGTLTIFFTGVLITKVRTTMNSTVDNGYQ